LAGPACVRSTQTYFGKDRLDQRLKLGFFLWQRIGQENDRFARNFRWINATIGIRNKNRHCSGIETNLKALPMLFPIIVDAVLLLAILGYLVFALTPSEPM
jgi:hypothetical protein